MAALDSEENESPAAIILKGANTSAVTTRLGTAFTSESVHAALIPLSLVVSVSVFTPTFADAVSAALGLDMSEPHPEINPSISQLLTALGRVLHNIPPLFGSTDGPRGTGNRLELPGTENWDPY